MVCEVTIGPRSYRVELERVERPRGTGPVEESEWNVRLDGRLIPVKSVRINGNTLSLILDGRSLAVRLSRTRAGGEIFLGGRAYEYTLRDPRSRLSQTRTRTTEAGEQKITASMPGRVVRVLAHPGEAIQIGQGILVIEAMKMQNVVRSSKDGALKKLLVAEGANVNAGEVLAVIE
jgi:biotin carboxyl carrier protein